MSQALESRQRDFRTLHVLDGPKTKEITSLVDQARKAGLAVRSCRRAAMDRMCRGGRHQGLVLEGRDLGWTSLDGLIEECRNHRQGSLLVLDQVQDPRNLGALIRTAAVAGCQGVVAAQRRNAPLSEAALKAAAGAAEKVALARVSNLSQGLRKLDKAGFEIVGADGQAKQSCYGHHFQAPLALVVGSEGHGLRTLTRRHCHYLLRIPGRKDFGVLNVSVATGVLLFEARRQWEQGAVKVLG